MFILDKTLCATHKYEIVSILSLTGLFFGDKLCDIVVYPPPPYIIVIIQFGPLRFHNLIIVCP